MIQIIFGKKGSGKTKRIFDMANEAAAKTEGLVFFVNDGKSDTINLKPQIRFVNAGEYAVAGVDPTFGFLAGLLAGNYDISYLFVDGFLKLTGTEGDIAGAIAKLDKIAAAAQTTIVLTYSADVADVPESIRKFAI